MKLKLMRRFLISLLLLLGAANCSAQSICFNSSATVYSVGSAILCASGTQASAPVPTFSPNGGSFSTAQTLTISDAAPSPTIYYTVDGSTPTTGSTVYSAPFTVAMTETVKAIATASGFSQSGVGVAFFTITYPITATPTFSPLPGTYNNTTAVSISDSTPSSTIYYTTDGSTPTTGSTVYSVPVAVTTTTNMKAIATAPGYVQSGVGSALYTLQTATPTFSPGAGTYSTAQSVTISDATTGSSIYYTADGSTPTTGSTPYTSPVNVASSETLKAIATASGFSQSSVGSASYTITVTGGTCPQTSGTLTVNATATRANGISPLLVFYDATATTDSGLGGAGTTFQDVYYSWNFGDGGASGTGTWAYGSNPGVNSMNVATGGIAAHLYIISDGGGNKNFTATVTAKDGTNTVSCTLPQVTVYDASGANGFQGSATTCVSTSGTFTGCPAGATHTTSANFNMLNGNLAGKRYLFRCTETFTGDNKTISGVKWSIGAYGGCQGTQTNRPIFSDQVSSNNSVMLIAVTSTGDGRISDIDCEGNVSSRTANGCASGQTLPPYQAIGYQITLWNLNSTGLRAAFAWNQCAQCALIGSTDDGAAGGYIVDFINSGENNPSAQSGNPAGNAFNNLKYQAIIGDHIIGMGAGGGGGTETLRISAGSYEVIENNTIQDANNVGAVLKLHSGNTSASSSTWAGVYTQYVEISDNLFTGNSGANLAENAPQNAGDDERLRYFVVERNLFAPTTGAPDGRDLLVSAVNETVRDNVFYIASGTSNPPFLGVQLAKRGIEPAPQNLEIYNNTCNFLATQSGQACIGFTGTNFSGTTATNSIAQNNLVYSSSGNPVLYGSSCGGGTNTCSNNTSTTTNNPLFIDGSGNFSLISDFKPTANYSGALNGVPNLYDALGTAWSPTWDLGAVHH